MYRLLPLLLLFLVFIAGCGGHSSRHATAHAHIQRCGMFPCGGEVVYHTMEVEYLIKRATDDTFVLSGTLTPRGGPEGAKIDVAVLSFELSRDITITDSYEVPLEATVYGPPITFRHEFTPSGGFDGISFEWDVHLAE